jgi:hypothetical protein
MSLTDITCCHGGPHTVECNYCSHSPRCVSRQDIEIEHTRHTLVASVAVEQALDGGAIGRRSGGLLSSHDDEPAPAEQPEFERTAKRILAEGANTALTMVEIGLAAGLTPANAIALARRGADVWEPARGGVS